MVGFTRHENCLPMGLNGHSRSAGYSRETQNNERMDGMENTGQGMVTNAARDGLLPAPQYTQKQARGMLGIQDQGMVEEMRHSNHETKEVLRMLGENHLRCTFRSSRFTNEGADGTTAQCRERCIHRRPGKRRKDVLAGHGIGTSGCLRF